MVAIGSNTRQTKLSARWNAPRCVIVTLLIALAGCEFPGRPDPADKPVPSDQVLSFSALYAQNCSGCHGAEGRLGPAPPLNDALFRSIISASELESVVTSGRPKSLMPAFGQASGGTLTPAQIQVVVHEIKGMSYKIIAKQDAGRATTEIVVDASGIAPTWGSVPEATAGTPDYFQPRQQGDSDSGGIRQGALVFIQACAACHGPDGQGITEGNQTHRVLNDRVALQLISDQALRRLVITGRPDLGMPDYAGARPHSPHFQPLTERDVAHVVALLASWRQGASMPSDLV